MQTELLKKITTDFLNKEKSISQNKLARRANIPISTFSKFLNGKFPEINFEQEAKLISIVKPEMSDIDVVAGKIKNIINKQFSTAIANAAILQLAENIQKKAI